MLSTAYCGVLQQLIGAFQKFFEVILGLNEKEAQAVGQVLGLRVPDVSRDGLAALSLEIQRATSVGTVVVHPVSYALACSDGVVSLVDGPFVERPLITTGAGDHFNSGFCLGKLLGFDNAASVLCGVTTSGYYVRTANSPGVEDLAGMLRSWPSR